MRTETPLATCSTMVERTESAKESAAKLGPRKGDAAPMARIELVERGD